LSPEKGHRQLESEEIPNFKLIFQTTHWLIHSLNLPNGSPASQYMESLKNPLLHMDIAPDDVVQAHQASAIIQEKATVNAFNILQNMQRGELDAVFEAVRTSGDVNAIDFAYIRSVPSFLIESEVFDLRKKEKEQRDNWERFRSQPEPEAAGHGVETQPVQQQIAEAFGNDPQQDPEPLPDKETIIKNARMI